MICDECETVAHCLKNGCVPKQPALKPLTDDEIIWLVPGLLDCLCDPYDYNKSGDIYASIPTDMVRLARAVEAHHGITEKGHP